MGPTESRRGLGRRRRPVSPNHGERRADETRRSWPRPARMIEPLPISCRRNPAVLAATCQSAPETSELKTLGNQSRACYSALKYVADVWPGPGSLAKAIAGARVDERKQMNKLAKSALVGTFVAVGLAVSSLGAAADEYLAAAGNGGVSMANANGGAVAIGDIFSGENVGNIIRVGNTWGDVWVDGGATANSLDFGITAAGGVGIADSSGGDDNIAFDGSIDPLLWFPVAN